MHQKKSLPAEKNLAGSGFCWMGIFEGVCNFGTKDVCFHNQVFNCLSSQGKGNREQLPLVICVQWTSAALPCFFPCETLWSSIFNSNVLSTWNCGSWEAFLEKWTATLGSMGVVIKSPNSTQASFTLYAATRACRFFLTPVEVAVVPGREIHQWGYGRKLNICFFHIFFQCRKVAPMWISLVPGPRCI